MTISSGSSAPDSKASGLGLIALEAEIFLAINGLPQHTAFHYHSLLVLR